MNNLGVVGNIRDDVNSDHQSVKVNRHQVSLSCPFCSNDSGVNAVVEERASGWITPLAGWPPLRLRIPLTLALSHGGERGQWIGVVLLLELAQLLIVERTA